MSKEFKLEYAANFDYEHYKKVLKESGREI